MLVANDERRWRAAEAEFGRAVRRYRTQRGWTQHTLASQVSQLGVPMHQTTIAKMEAGQRQTSIREVFLLAEALAVEPDVLFPHDIGRPDRQTVVGLRAELDEVEQRMARAMHFRAQAQGELLLATEKLEAHQKEIESLHSRSQRIRNELDLLGVDDGEHQEEA